MVRSDCSCLVYSIIPFIMFVKKSILYYPFLFPGYTLVKQKIKFPMASSSHKYYD